MANPNTNSPEYKRQENTKQNSITYPLDLGKQPIYMTLIFKDYQSLSGQATKGIRDTIGKTVGVKTLPITKETIHLPIPQGLNDNYDLEYRTESLGALGGIASTIDQTVRGGGADIVGNVGSFALQKIREIGGAAVAALGDVAGVGNQAATIAELEFGAISNPNLAAVFKGMNLREHSFRWKLIASNLQESEIVQAIVKTIKQSALPTKELEGNFALNYPRIAYAYLRGPNRNIINFSRRGAFVKKVSVSYDGQNYPTFFKGVGTFNPVEVQLSITLVERSIITREDIF
jgi:hypothetical protein